MRRACPDDLPALERLEQLCWPPPLRTASEELGARLTRCPDGQYVAELNGRVVGAIYSQRIVALGQLDGATVETVTGLHDPQGKVIQLLAVNSDPAHGELALGDCLLEFMLELVTTQTDVEAVVAVSLCSAHSRHRDVDPNDYLMLRSEDGQLVDPTLHFHEHHGARIVGIVEGYRPLDRDNEGRGVLVHYDLATREAAGAPHREAPLPVEQRAGQVRAAIVQALRARGHEDFSLDVPLREQGLDSLGLVQLRAALQRRLSTAVAPTLFFRCPTPAGLIRFFEEGAEPNGPEPPREHRVAQPFAAEHGPRPESAARRRGRARPAVAGPTSPAGAAIEVEPIAIIGMACRFPGARHLDAYWNVLRDGVDALSGPPIERCGMAAAATAPGGFLADIDAFDAELFGISPREAPYIDPQQRLLLEVAWSAFENAGLAPRALRGSATGVFVGAFLHDYEQVHRAVPRGAEADNYFATGTCAALLAGRLAYAFGFGGPALVVDTACSSSLVAVHQACQSLRAAECDVALAAGVNLILDPHLTEAFASAGMLAVDGRCKVFDARADGYVRSEGCAVVVLTPLSRALERGDAIAGVIRGSAINQDGASNGLTAPNGLAQQAVIRAALAAAGVAAPEVGYVEAHGTGTALGDPIEVEALVAALGGDRETALIVGSGKANIGHTEAASGIAGLIKVVLSLAHDLIPAQPHFETANPLLRLEHGPVTIPRQATRWPAAAPLGGVSSFGFSGTNAHVVLGPSPERTIEHLPEPGAGYVLALSARSESALMRLLARYRAHLTGVDQGALGDVAYSAATGRSHEAYRVALTGNSLHAIRQALERGPEPTHARSGPLLAALFTGQGAQYPGMGAELYRSEPCFAEVLDRCERLLADELDVPLLDVMYGEAGDRLQDTAYAQPALFALSMALHSLWQSWGIRPAAVLGHSLGEYAAACIAGVFSLEDGLRLVAARGRILSAAPGDGAMAAVFASELRVASAIAPWSRDVSVAAVNGASNVVISGERRRVDLVLEQLESQGLTTSRLNVSHAFHSPLMDAALEPFCRVVQTIHLHAPRLPLVSNVSGDLASDEVTEADYWVRHVREPVRFAAGMETLRRLGHDVFLEMGPRPVLLGMARADRAAAGCHWLACLNAEQPDTHPRSIDVSGAAQSRPMTDSLARLYTLGFEVDWSGVFAYRQQQRVPVPGTPFEHRRYWLSPGPRSAFTRQAGEALHPMLGQRLQSAALPATTWAFRCSPPPPAAAHQLRGEPLLSAAYLLEIARAAGARAHETDAVAVSNATFISPVPACSDDRVEVVLDGTGHFQICSLPQGAEPPVWREHVNGQVGPASFLDTVSLELEAVRLRFGPEASVSTFYEALAERGIDYGAGSRALSQLWHSDGEALAMLALPPHARAEDYPSLHPSLLDAGLQAAQAALPQGGSWPWVPVGVTRLDLLRRALGRVWCLATVRPRDGDGTTLAGELHVDLQWADSQGCLARLSGLTLVRLPSVGEVSRGDASGAGEPIDELMYAVRWQPRIEFGGSLEFLPQTTEIAAALATDSVEAPAALTQALEASSLDWIVRAFVELGCPLAVGRRVNTGTLPVDLQVRPEHHALFRRLLGIVEEAGYLRRIGAGHEVVRQDAGEAAIQSAPLDGVSSATPEARLLARCGRALASALRGETDPLDLIFPEADLSTAAELYRESAAFAPMNALLAHAVRLCTARIACGRGLRILEVGGGTGATTAHLLPALRQAEVRYVFTDVSASFTEHARQHFGNSAGIEFRTLDIERDPVEQGFEAEAYDIVIAANVLHATADLRQSLAQVRRLLRPGGTLLLLEGTERRAWVDVIFGLLPGWWKFSDSELRPDHPLLTEARWLTLLSECGFENPCAQTAWRSPERAAFPQSLLMATAACRIATTRRARVFPPAGAPAHTEGLPSHNDDEQDEWAHDPEPSRVLLFWPDRLGSDAREQVARQAHASRQTIVHVLPGCEYECVDPGLYVIDPGSELHYQRLLQDIAPVTSVVHAWSTRVSTTDELQVAFELGCGSVLNLVKALNVVREGRPVADLWIVTAGAQAVVANDRVPGVMSSTLWGLGRTVAAEQPEFHCRLVDLEPDGLLEGLGQLLALLSSRGLEFEHFALREGRRWVPELHRAAPPPISRGQVGDEAASTGNVQGGSARDTTAFDDRMPAPGVRADGSYLVVGGLGGVGQLVARWLVARGARHLVLAGRRDPNADAEAFRRSLCRGAGVRVDLVSVDVSQLEPVRELIRGLRAAGHCLRGVVHAAGVCEDRLILAHDTASLERVFAPKVAGAWHLHRALTELCPEQGVGENRELDFFVLCSSATALLWCAGLGNYAAANAFLDALAQHRRARGLPASSIGWGPWQGVGMAAQVSAQRRAQWAAQGLRPSAPERCLAALGRLLDASATNCLVVDANWSVAWQSADDGARGLLAALFSPGTGSGTPKLAPDVSSATLESVLAAPEGLREQALLAYLEALLVEVLGREPGTALDPNAGFFSLGLDSLTATDLRYRLERQLELAIEAAAPFKYPNLASLSRHLAARLSDRQPARSGDADASFSRGESKLASSPVGPTRRQPNADIGAGQRDATPAARHAGAIETELAKLEALLEER